MFGFDSEEEMLAKRDKMSASIQSKYDPVGLTAAIQAIEDSEDNEEATEFAVATISSLALCRIIDMESLSKNDGGIAMGVVIAMFNQYLTLKKEK